jgi:hypothetical protein
MATTRDGKIKLWVLFWAALVDALLGAGYEKQVARPKSGGRHEIRNADSHAGSKIS